MPVQGREHNARSASGTGAGGCTCPGKGTQPTPLNQMKELGAGEKCEAVLCQLSSQRGREMTLLVRQRIAERR